MPNHLNREQFLNMAALFEGGLVLIAVALGWLVGVNPLDYFVWNWLALLWGMLGAIPMILFFFLTYRFPLGAMRNIKQLLLDVLGPSLVACRWYELALLSLLVGFCEEFLFRGLLQPWFEELWGAPLALIGSNILFGLAHFITPFYALLAGASGCYLGWLLDGTGERNLLVPVMTHAVYDYVAFLVVARTYRRMQTQGIATELLDEVD